MVSGFFQELRVWPSIMKTQIQFKRPSHLNFTTLRLEAVRVPSGIVNLGSNNDCSNPFIFRGMTFYMIFKKKFRKLILEKWLKF